MSEVMEPRRLFAASIGQDDYGVVATGTEAADTFTVEPVDANTFRVTVNSISQEFERDGPNYVAVVRLEGLGGDDQFTAAPGLQGFVQFSMIGGAGVDTMTSNESDTYFSGGEIYRANGRTVAIEQADGGLLVLGTAGADRFKIFGASDSDGEQVEIDSYFHGHFGPRTYFRVDAGAGDDTVFVNGPFLSPLRLNGQDGNDVLDASGNYPTVTARGGNGNDTLRGGAGNDQLFGEAGNDVIRGFDGNDRMDGGANDDLLDGGLGSDEFIGGLGIDLADYSNRLDNLTIGIGSYADDGASGERDNVRTGVENVTAGSGNDTITGDGVRNVLRGNAGSDTIRGMGGNDFINPGTGADRVYGGDGDDEIYARDSIRDLVLDGGSGTDRAQRDSTDPRTSIEQTIA